jgi:hypothetical protein
VLLLAAGLRAQDAPRPRIHPDSIPIDTVDVWKPPTLKQWVLGLAGTATYLVVAPAATSGLLLFPARWRPTPGDTSDVGAPANTVRSWVSAGTGPGIGAYRRADWSGTAAMGLEVLTYGFLVDAKWEHVWIPEHLELRTAHVGWLAHPRGGLLGGVTVGYRDAHGPRMLSGVDFGFPMVIAGKDGSWTKLEPSYVVGRAGAGYTMSYRLEMSPPRNARALWPGLVIEGRGLNENDGIVSVSARYGMRQALR